ncbi:MAG TPA: hypothetical protein VG815_21550 [Chloroflexota bacterium]|jgi:hypothetical protein|nr:hypothetical protein [Chloroflexota bacterium]
MGIHVHVTFTHERPPEGAGRRRLFRRSALAIIVATSLILAATGVAVANIPDAGTGVFHGCVSNANGVVRLFDPSKGAGCTSQEHGVSWNERGVNWRGTWSSSTSYRTDDAVGHDGSSYLAKTGNTNALPGKSSDWTVLSMAGTNGSTILNGSGEPSIDQGSVGDFYLDTSAEVLYGPKFQFCLGAGRKKRCSAVWPSAGTSLVGPPGNTGPPGDTGPPGPAGPSHVFNTYGTAYLSGFADKRVMTLQLPAGNYLVSAKLEALNQDTSIQRFTCELYVNYDNSLSNQIDSELVRPVGKSPSSDTYAVPMTLQGTVLYDSPGYAVVACNTYNGNADSGTLSAIQVAAIN